jgi:4-diphosphocytidyl-2C-methyl-D-erythritol kinase
LSSIRGQDWYNDLAQPARAVCPQLDRLCELLEAAGAQYQVAGSGSSVAVFGDHDVVWDAFPEEIRNKEQMWVAQTRLVT